MTNSRRTGQDLEEKLRNSSIPGNVQELVQKIIMLAHRDRVLKAYDLLDNSEKIFEKDPFDCYKIAQAILRKLPYEAKYGDDSRLLEMLDVYFKVFKKMSAEADESVRGTDTVHYLGLVFMEILGNLKTREKKLEFAKIAFAANISSWENYANLVLDACSDFFSLDDGDFKQAFDDMISTAYNRNMTTYIRMWYMSGADPRKHEIGKHLKEIADKEFKLLPETKSEDIEQRAKYLMEHLKNLILVYDYLPQGSESLKILVELFAKRAGYGVKKQAFDPLNIDEVMEQIIELDIAYQRFAPQHMGKWTLSYCDYCSAYTEARASGELGVPRDLALKNIRERHLEKKTIDIIFYSALKELISNYEQIKKKQSTWKQPVDKSSINHQHWPINLVLVLSDFMTDKKRAVEETDDITFKSAMKIIQKAGHLDDDKFNFAMKFLEKNDCETAIYRFLNRISYQEKYRNQALFNFIGSLVITECWLNGNQDADSIKKIGTDFFKDGNVPLIKDVLIEKNRLIIVFDSPEPYSMGVERVPFGSKEVYSTRKWRSSEKADMLSLDEFDGLHALGLQGMLNAPQVDKYYHAKEGLEGRVIADIEREVLGFLKNSEKKTKIKVPAVLGSVSFFGGKVNCMEQINGISLARFMADLDMPRSIPGYGKKARIIKNKIVKKHLQDFFRIKHLSKEIPILQKYHVVPDYEKKLKSSFRKIESHFKRELPVAPELIKDISSALSKYSSVRKRVATPFNLKIGDYKNLCSHLQEQKKLTELITTGYAPAIGRAIAGNIYQMDFEKMYSITGVADDLIEVTESPVFNLNPKDKSATEKYFLRRLTRRERKEYHTSRHYFSFFRNIRWCDHLIDWHGTNDISENLFFRYLNTHLLQASQAITRISYKNHPHGNQPHSLQRTLFQLSNTILQ